jgi:hypothetical protein
MSRADRARAALAAIAVAAAPSFPMRPALSAAPLTIAVADFDYADSSGEVKDQRADHKAHVALFVELVRASFEAHGDYRVLSIDCPQPPCTPVNMHPDDFLAAARRSGARFVVYGGIHKMSTLVQWGDVELLDLDADKLLLRRTVTFRGDNDEAYRRAAAFVGETVRDAMTKR